MPSKSPIIFAGLTEKDVRSITHKHPRLSLWDTYRKRVEFLRNLEENEMVMAIYQLMFEQEGRAKWMGEAISYSWIDAALFLADRYPSYVDNFALTFRELFAPCTHYGFYESEDDCLRLNRVLPGIQTFSKAHLHDALKKMTSSSIHKPGVSP